MDRCSGVLASSPDVVPARGQMATTLGVHIMDLRRKLEAYGPRLIHTLRGRGFLFGEARGPVLKEDR